MATAGDVSFPEYLSDTHSYFMLGAVDAGTGFSLFDPTSAGVNTLPSSVLRETSTLLSGTNPFEAIEAHDPDMGISLYNARLEEYDSLVNALDPLVDWDAMSDAGITVMDLAVPTNAEIDAEIEADKAANLADLGRRINRISAGFFDINAVISTAFPAAQAIAESEWAAQWTARGAAMKTQRDQIRATVYTQAVDQMLQLTITRIQAYGTTLNARDNLVKYETAAKTDQARLNAEFNVQEATWDFNALLKGAGAISVIQGIPVVAERLTPFQSVLGTLGTVIPLALSIASAL